MSIRICSFLFLFLFVWINHTSAQDIKVLEKNTNEPIAGVVLYNSDKSKSISTNIEGLVSISMFDSDEVIYFQNILYKKFNTTKGEIIAGKNLVFLELKIEGLDQVLISASKFEQNNKDIPQHIISLNAEDIKFANPQTSADALLEAGNVYIQKSQLGGGSPMIRGFSTNRLLITVDGVRMNNAIFRGGNLQNVISIDPFTIQNTEITLGSGSVVYGSDAIGGVMSFYTKKPQLSYKDSLYFTSNAALRYSSSNFEKTGHLHLNFGYKKWAFLSSISYTNFDDLRMGSHGPDDYLRPEFVVTENGIDSIVVNPDPQVQVPTGYSQINLMQKVRYELSDNLNFDLGFFLTKTSDYPRYDRLLRYSGDTLRSAEWNYGPQQWLMTNLQVTKLSSTSSFYDKMKATIAYQNFKESRSDRDFQSILRNRTQENVDAYSFNLDLEKTLSKSSSLFYGVEYIFNKVASRGTLENIETNTSDLTVSRYPDGSTWQSLAAYANYKFKPHPKFVLQSGLRYNQVFSNSDFTFDNQFLNLPFNEAKLSTGALTGSTGFTWLPNKIIQWKFNLSTAFRAPNIDDIGKVFDSEPGSVVVPNNDLKPEYSVGGDLGLQLNFGSLKLDVNTFYTFLDNALIRRDFMLNGQTEIIYNGELSNVQAIQNASKAWIYGFEAALNLRLSESLSLNSQYNIIGGTEEDENGIEVPVRHVAPAFGSTRLVYQKNNWKLDAFVQYNGEFSFNQLAPSEKSKAYLYALDENGNPYSPSWYTFNLRSSYQFNNNLFVSAALENITDRRYRTYSSGISAPGRNLVLSLNYTL